MPWYADCLSNDSSSFLIFCFSSWSGWLFRRSSRLSIVSCLYRWSRLSFDVCAWLSLGISSSFVYAQSVSALSKFQIIRNDYLRSWPLHFVFLDKRSHPHPLSFSFLGSKSKWFDTFTRSVIKTTTTTTTTTSRPSIIFTCAGRANGYYPDPIYCNKFHYCATGKCSRSFSAHISNTNWFSSRLAKYDGMRRRLGLFFSRTWLCTSWTLRLYHRWIRTKIILPSFIWTSEFFLLFFDGIESLFNQVRWMFFAIEKKKRRHSSIDSRVLVSVLAMVFLSISMDTLKARRESEGEKEKRRFYLRQRVIIIINVNWIEEEKRRTEENRTREMRREREKKNVEYAVARPFICLDVFALLCIRRVRIRRRKYLSHTLLYFHNPSIEIVETSACRASPLFSMTNSSSQH